MFLDQYYLIGNPVKHSLSPAIHRHFARLAQQNIKYDTLLVTADQFSATIDHLRQSGAKGVNITAPFKQLAWHYADQLTPRAKLAGAVNTFKFTPEGICLGDNTDGPGLINDITQNLACNLFGKRILLLGAGGAVRGVLKSLLDEKPALVILANRTVEKAVDLATDFVNYGPVQAHRTPFTDFPPQPFDFIINGTSASLTHHPILLPDFIVGNTTICYDMVYDLQQPTIFMEWAQQCGCYKTSDGLGMLICQAAESFYWWRGIKPDIDQKFYKSLRIH